MRTRTAKKLAQRIDLSYFKRSHPLRRWRTTLSIAAPLIGLAWLGTMAAAGSRAPYSSGPLSSSHAFTEMRCETCHVRDTSFRAHVTDMACLTCHDGPSHPPAPVVTAVAATPAPHRRPSPPACATCHREHQGQMALASTPDGLCIDCHSGSSRSASMREEVEGFPGGHPPFTTERETTDRGTIKFNHEVHAKTDLRGPTGPETLACITCHQPELLTGRARRTITTGLMKPIEYEQQCARCHQLFFDERIERPAPHDEPRVVVEFISRELRAHITNHPGDLSRRDGPPRRLPLNFPRPGLPPARTADEWVARGTAAAEQLLWEKTCAECHTVDRAAEPALPSIAPANMKRPWMTRASFDHTPHLMLRCESCHAAANSRLTSDVLMPAAAACATCHAPDKGAPAACATCHQYHDWSNARPVKPAFDLNHFR